MTDRSPSSLQHEAGPHNFAWPERYSILFLILATLLSLLPFSNKAIHIDDPLYLWTAQHIVQRPLDPYGFRVVWYETEMPIGDLINNPPLAPYYAAAWGSLFGWSERVLHFAFLFPALAVVLGTYCLARRFTRHPVWAAVAALFSPGFFVSSTTLMCDVLMLALWMLAVVLWLEAVDSGKPLYFAGSVVLVAACALAKFFGVALLLLLPVYSLLQRKRIVMSFAYLGVPIFALSLYQLWTHQTYGRGLLGIAMQYASFHNQGHELPILTRTITVLSFAGGSALPALFLVPFLWPRKWIAVGAVLCGVIGLAVARHWIRFDAPQAVAHWPSISIQMAITAAGGLSVLALGLRGFSRRMEPGIALLSLWILGTFCFSGFVNWTTNARSILPVVPAVAILLIRSIEQTGASLSGHFPLKFAAPVLLSAMVAVWAARADAKLANTGREAAKQISAELQGSQTPVYFEGHWGFHYYMQQAGAKPADLRKSAFRSGDVLVIPENTTNSFGPPPGFTLDDVRIIRFDLHQRLATMSQSLGAGFYASVWGPLPFAFGEVPPERYLIARLRPVAVVTDPAPLVFKRE